MLNWYRWAPEGQIIFMAPTKPLVHQQIEACYQIAGIPRSQTAVLTGGLKKDVRHEYWEERRVFFMTPQTVQMDLSHGLCDPKRIVCLVVDEAHRATGNYAYVDVVKRIRQHNTSFRVLALTATPGSTIEGVQSVVDSLGISKVEIRTDESIDIRQYVQKRTLDVQSFPLSVELQEIHDLYCKCLEPMLKILNNAKAYYQTRPENLSVFGLLTARTQFMNSPAARNMNQAFYWSLVKTFFDLTVLAHPLNLLTSHGVRLFYSKLTQQSLDIDDWDKDDKARKRRDTAFNALRTERPYAELLERTKALVDDPNFSGHPKMDHMIGSILAHFSEAEDSGPTKIIVFTSYRDSAEEACRLLRRHEPLVRPHVFVGQARSLKSAGMSQKEQLEVSVLSRQPGRAANLGTDCSEVSGRNV
jgi:ATP-dependent DNA helicase MPH1